MDKSTVAAEKKITVTIDGKICAVPEGLTILQAARSADIYIPTLCYLECLPGYGACRLCMVEVENMRGYPTACTTPVSQGMVVTTKSDELQALRSEILELLLSEHPYTCLVCRDKDACREYMHSTRKVGTTTGCNFCPENGCCELQSLVAFLELDEIRFPIIYRNLSPVRNNPFYDLDYNLCILCGKCVRICAEERYSEVLAFINRGNSAIVGTAFDETQKEAGCEYCGACVDVCPTGALHEKMGRWLGPPDRSTRTNCAFCGISCEMTVNSRGNRIVNAGPEPGKKDDPLQLCMRGKFIPGDLTHHPERITRPHIKKAGKWIEVKWQDAIGYISTSLKNFKGNQFGLIGSAHDTVENSLVLQKFARQIMNSPNVDLYPTIEHHSIVKDIHDYYTACGHVKVDDILRADTVYVIGCQASWSHPIVENRIRKAYKCGKKVVVANSVKTRTLNFSTNYQRYAKNSEHVFLHHLVEKMAADNSGENILMIIGDEVLFSDHAKENFNNLMRISKLSGNTVRMLFLLPEANRYGATMAGMNPSLLPGFSAARKRGLTAEQMLKKQGVISALYLVGDIPYVRALKGLKFFVQQNMFFTPASEHAQVFLPMANSMESDGHIINLEGTAIQLRPVVTMDSYSLATSDVMEKIAAAMVGKQSCDIGPASLAEQTRSLLKVGLARGRKVKFGRSSTPDLKSRSKFGQLTRERLEKHHFHYMGNNLADIVPDLRKVLEE